MIDRRGETLWRWEYARTNAYIVPGAIAISPSCDAIALVGSPAYRYTWLADRRGRRIVLGTSTTPLGAVFDHTGSLLALGTGGRDVLLFGRNGALRWKKTLDEWCCTVQSLSFSADDRSILVRGWGIAVLTVDGAVLWSSMQNQMNASRDLRTFVAWWQPPHGPGIGHVTVLDRDGREIWDRFASQPQAVVSSDGTTVVARINDNQQPAEEDAFHVEEQKTSLQVLSREGSVVRTLNVTDGVPIAISGDGRRVLLRSSRKLEEIDLDGNHLLEIAMPEYGAGNVLVAPDFTAVAVLTSNDTAKLRWYGLK